MSQGTVFSIEEFSIYDGPGIRTTVFFKGCPLRCSWCHSPEGQQSKPEIVKSPNGCLHCGSCLQAGIAQPDGVILTEESIAVCPRGLLRMCGQVYSAQELTKKLCKNQAILQQEGGVTFSGGEPLLQGEFLLECLSLLKGRLHTAVQTCGYCQDPLFEEVLSAADYILFDLKIIDDAMHKVYTGRSNQSILRHFHLLARSDTRFCIRVPLIPGVTDTQQNIAAIASLLQEEGIAYAELMPYHNMAGSKYAMTGRSYQPNFDVTLPPNPRQEIFEAHGIQTKLL